MVLEYSPVGCCGRSRVKARVTTEHPSSHYGQPVIVLSSGDVLDYQSWVLMAYKIHNIGKKEFPLMERWLKNLCSLLGNC